MMMLGSRHSGFAELFGSRAGVLSWGGGVGGVVFRFVVCAAASSRAIRWFCNMVLTFLTAPDSRGVFSGLLCSAPAARKERVRSGFAIGGLLVRIRVADLFMN